MVRMGRMAATAAMIAVLAVVVGCGAKPEPAPQPKVAPPAVKAAGVLVVGVDLSTPPFAGVDQGKQAGIDVDVAAALADNLGLAVKYADVKPSEAASALADGTADVVLSIPYGQSATSQLSLAGTYITDAPAVFVAIENTGSVEPSLTIDTITQTRIAAQKESMAYWLIQQSIDADVLKPYDTLRQGMQALVDKQVDLLAGDFIVGTYMARDFPEVRYAGRIGSPSPLAAAVAVDNATLGDAVRGSLDELAADGVLTTIRRKWLGEAPDIKADASTEASPTP